MIKHISPSSLTTFFSCGELYRRRYIEQEVIPPGIAAHVGRGFHSGAEHNHKQKLETGEDEPEDVICDAARDGYKQSVENGIYLPPDEKDQANKLLSEGLDSAVTLARLYRQEFAPQVLPEYVEKRLWLEVDDLPVPIHGVLDLGCTGGWLLDMKTSGRKWTQDKADSNVGLSVYPRLYREITGEVPQRITVEAFINKKKPEHQTIETNHTEADFQVFVERARYMVQMIQAGIFPPAEPGHWKCSPRWCGYWWTCPFIPKHKKDSRR